MRCPRREPAHGNSTHHSRSRVVGLPCVLLGAALWSLSAAHAASLGGLAAGELTAFALPSQPPVPTVYAADPLDSPAGQDLAVRTTPTGNKPWTVHGGPITVTTSGADVPPTSWADIDSGHADMAVEATLLVPNPPPPRAATLVVNSDGDERIWAEYRRSPGGGGSGELSLHGLTSQIAPVAVDPPRGSYTMRLESHPNEIRVLLEGAVLIAYPLSQADIDRYKQNTGAGFGAGTGGPGSHNVQVLDWRVESLS